MSETKRFYLQLDNGNNDIITLVFRTEKAANRHINKNKEYKILHKSYEYPEFKDNVLSQSKLTSLFTAIDYYRPKLKEDVEFTDFENRNFARTGAIV